MKRYILAATAALALLGTWPAAAADLPRPIYKAQPKATLGGCGWYGLLGTHAENDNVGVTGQTNNLLAGGLGGSFTVGASLDAGGGYMCADPTSLKFIDVRGSYENIGTSGIVANPATATVVGTSSVNSKYSFMERAGIGADWSSVLSYIPIGSLLPSWSPLPAGAVDAHLYIFAFALQSRVNFVFDDMSTQVWQNRFGIGTGTKFRPSTTSTIVLDIWTGYAFAGGGFNINQPGGPLFANANTGRAWLIGADVNF
jgi:hypothetical protein